MCSAYWNLTATFTCPKCGKEQKDANLQTHWMGELGSCQNWYALGEPVDELKGVTATLPDAGDDFIGGCDDCLAWFDFGGRIENGAVVEVWPLQKVAQERPVFGTAP